MKKKSYFQKNGFKITVTAIILGILLAGVFFGTDIFLKKKLPMKYSEYVEKYSEEYGLDKYLVYSIISTESNFDSKAISSVGAVGLMQLMPETAVWVNEKYALDEDVENLTDPETNIRVGCCYFKYLLEKFGSAENAVYAYNGGEGNVAKWLNDSNYSDDGKTLRYVPFKETKNYLKKVNARYEIYKDLYSK